MSSTGATSMPWRFSTTQSNLMSWPTLRTERSSSTGLSRAITSPAGELARREPAAEKIVLAAVPDRHVAGLARRERERQADELGPVRVERIGLGVEGEDAGFARPGEDGVELLDRGDATIRLGVERDLGDLGRALGGKRRRHHHGCRLARGEQRHPPRSCRRGPAAPAPCAGSPRSAAWNCAWSHVIPPAPDRRRGSGSTSATSTA